jgi:threonylcarbamoyladenosine tRNA methylthiotransferase MtaB
MKSVAVMTLGCRFNQSESEAMLDRLTEAGYRAEESPEQADIVVINTCAVTAESQRKSRKLSRWAVRSRRLRPDRLVVVTGCYANLDPEEAAALQPDVVLGNAEKGRIAEWVRRAIEERGKVFIRVTPADRQPTLGELPSRAPQMRSRAFVRIQDGCSRWCSYCIIPLFRGRERSLEPSEILGALKDLERDGVREAVLTGIHLAAWGRDLAPRRTIDDLARSIADLSIGLRVRWSSLEPEETSVPFLRTVLANPERFCPHLHLPVQSGSNRILRQMKRGYTRERFRALLESARAIHAKAAFSTDVVVGFPGESETDFEETLALLEDCRLVKVHAFPYAARAGTVAASLQPLPPRSVRRRMTRLLLRAQSLRRQALMSYLGLTHSVLIEKAGTAPGDGYHGYSEYYLPAMVRSETATEGSIVRGTATAMCGDRLVVDPESETKQAGKPGLKRSVVMTYGAT